MWPQAAEPDLTAQSQSTSTGTQATLKRRASEHSRGASAPRNAHAQTAFFFRTEDDLEQTAGTSQSATSVSTARDSEYGVQSLASNISSTCEDSHREAEQVGGSGSPEDADNLSEILPALTATSWTAQQNASHSSSDSSPSRPLPRDVSNTALSGRFTPLHLYSPIGDSESGPASTPKSVSLRSLRMSDDGYGADDAASQAIASGDEEEEQESDPAEEAATQNAPQLVMPNLRLPSRRPFTEKGKNIGKLKIMVAGAKGVGKTSFIKSIVRACEDIVHVDPLTGASHSLSASDRWPRNTQGQTHVQHEVDNDCVTEVFASTRAYPTWWSELGESKILRRRQSAGEQVLERNICFVDTQGFDTASGWEAAYHTIQAIDKHVGTLLHSHLDFASMSDSDILSILSGAGGVQVHLILYLLEKESTEYDTELMRRLSEYALVVPVISKADLLSEEQLEQLRTSVASGMRSDDIPLMNLENTFSEMHAWVSLTGRSVWAVSSADGSDNDNMDASLLMSPDYIQPLMPSELNQLIANIFDPDKAAWLRHCAAKKFLHWRRSNPELLGASNAHIHEPPPKLPTPGYQPTSHPKYTLVSRPLPLHIPTAPQQPPAASRSSFTAARLADHTQREEALARVRLARWAADLQRALRSERERFAALHNAERRGWLLERWGEVQDASALPTHTHAQPLENGAPAHKPAVAQVQSVGVDPTDPLGLLEWDERARRRGLAVVQVLGSAGVFGAVVVLALRRWGVAFGSGLPFGGGGGASWEADSRGDGGAAWMFPSLSLLFREWWAGGDS